MHLLERQALLIQSVPRRARHVDDLICHSVSVARVLLLLGQQVAPSIQSTHPSLPTYINKLYLIYQPILLIEKVYFTYNEDETITGIFTS